MKVINADNFRSFAYSSENIVSRPIKGVFVFFFGLGGMDIYKEDIGFGKVLASDGILCIVPYYNPWSWMNRQAVDFTDELLDAAFEKYDLSMDTPVVYAGGSMGGLSALVYTTYAKRVPAACVASCPVCDLPYHYTERPDLPRTLYSAFGTYPGTLEDAMKTASPLHLIDKMPESTKYTIFHCSDDHAVNIKKHSERFVEVLSRHHDVTFHIVPGRDHCDLTEEAWVKFYDCVREAVKNG